MWLLFQCAVMIAVGWTGIYYEWTPNKVALGIVAHTQGQLELQRQVQQMVYMP